MSKMKIGTSTLSNVIYAGNTKVDKKGIETWVKKEDVTIQAITAVAEHMIEKCKESKSEAYEYNFKGFGKLIFEKEMEQ